MARPYVCKKTATRANINNRKIWIFQKKQKSMQREEH